MVVVEDQQRLIGTGLIGQLVDQRRHQRIERRGAGGAEQRAHPLADPRARPVQRGHRMTPEPCPVVITTIERQPSHGPAAASTQSASSTVLPYPAGAHTSTSPRRAPRRVPRPARAQHHPGSRAGHVQLGGQHHIPPGGGNLHHGRPWRFSRRDLHGHRLQPSSQRPRSQLNFIPISLSLPARRARWPGHGRGAFIASTSHTTPAGREHIAIPALARSQPERPAGTPGRSNRGPQVGVCDANDWLVTAQSRSLAGEDVIVGARNWIDSWPVYRQLTGADRLGRGAAVKSNAHRGSCDPDGRRRQGRQVGLPVLRGGLRAERLRPGRQGHPDRGRPGLAGQPRPAVPQGLGEPAADHRRRPPVPGAVPAPVRHRVGARWSSTRRWT